MEPTSQPKASWKDSPIAVGAICISGTVALAVLVYKEVLLPTHTAALQNQVLKLTTEAESYKSRSTEQQTSQRELEQKIASLEGDLKRKAAQFVDAQNANLFAADNPYPIGLRAIKVGDLANRLKEIYPESALEGKEGYWVLKSEHANVSRSVYYFDEKKPGRPITHILFMFDKSKLPTEILERKLIDALGTPNDSPRKGYLYWKLSKIGVFKFFDEVMLTVDNFTPSTWPTR